MHLVAGYRLLAPRDTLLGPSGGALENAIVDPLETGALCWVRGEQSLYYLNKSSTATIAPPTVIATSRGAGEPGRWIQAQNASGGLIAAGTLPSDQAESVDVTGSFPDFEQLSSALVLFIPNALGRTVVAMLVVNSGDNLGFGVGLRITYSSNGIVWTAMPGASLIDSEDDENRPHLSVMGVVAGVADMEVRAEWTAFGDAGTWTVHADGTGSASLAVFMI